MKLSIEAQAWLNATVQRVMARHHVGESERAGIHYELMSHLHSAAERKAEEAGHSEVGVGDLQAAVLDMGGEEALVGAFVAPHAKPLPRAGVTVRAGAVIVDYLIIVVAWHALAAIVALAWVFVAAPFGTLSAQQAWSQAWDLIHAPWVGRGLFGAGGALVSISVLAYFAYLEGTRGQTLGKRAFNLWVKRTDGTAPSCGAAVVRNLVKAFPPLLFLDTLLLLVFFHEEKQRVSDRLVQTIVVELKT